MNSSERLDALLCGKPIDRVPFFSFALGFCARNVGLPVASVYRDPTKSFWAQVWTREQYGYDSGPFYAYASYGGWEFGGELKFPEGQYEQAPSLGRLAVQSEEEVWELELPDVRKAGSLPLAMEFSKLQEAHGFPVSLVLGGPFTIAGNICGAGVLCRWLIRNTEVACQLLRLAMDHILDVVRHWVDTFGPRRVALQIWEPLTSNQVISPRQFSKYVLPYEKELYDRLSAIRVKYVLSHLCGEQNLNLPYWAEVPLGDPAIVSFGREVDLADAVRYFGDKYVIAGNVGTSVMQNGARRELYEVCRQCVEKAKHAPRGYILMPGCEVPVMTPSHNLYVMRKAVDDWGWYER